MAQTREPFDWSNQRNLKSRAWRSVQEFFGKDEAEHALDPELVAGVSEDTESSDMAPDEKDPNAERIHRPTEQRRISENPNSVWPG